jgi:hypothetical protein
MYAQNNKVANNPRLNAVCARIADQLDDHYAEPTSIPAEDPATAGGGRGTTLQLAALDQARDDTARRHHDEDSQRLTVSAAPAR